MLISLLYLFFNPPSYCREKKKRLFCFRVGCKHVDEEGQHVFLTSTLILLIVAWLETITKTFEENENGLKSLLSGMTSAYLRESPRVNLHLSVTF